MSHVFRCDAPGCGREIGDGDDRHDVELRSWGRDFTEHTLHACSWSCRTTTLLSILERNQAIDRGVRASMATIDTVSERTIALLELVASHRERNQAIDRAVRPSMATIETVSERTIALLEQLRERCAQEADYEYEASKLTLSGPDCHSKCAAKHVRSIDVRAWLATGCPDRTPRSPR